MEDPNIRGGLCYGCHLDQYIPRWYREAEGYVRCETDGTRKACRRPRTGLSILDVPGGHRVGDLADRLTPGRLASMRAAEAAQGLTDLTG
jgi:hypothetical protein